MPRVKPEILLWARQTAGLSPAEAVHKLGSRAARGVAPLDRLAALETGAVEPTRPMLVKMAKHYRRPLLTFYLSAPPGKGDRGQDFRTLPNDHSAEDEAFLDALIRDVRARQSLVRAVLAEEEETVPLSFVGSMRQSDGVAAVVESIRTTLDFSSDQFRAAANPNAAFARLRSKTEAAGVFVLLIGNLGSHHTTISLDTFRGFVLADEIAPFIAINDQDSRAAWSFTVLHELTHLWLGQTGISGRRADRDVEQFCNDVAGEFLLPRAELAPLRRTAHSTAADIEPVIGRFAEARNISRSMVAYKLLRERVITRQVWRQLSDLFRERWQMERLIRRQRNREKQGGPSYYTLRRHRVGASLIELVGRLMAAGELTTSKAGRVLGVKPWQVQSLVDTAGAAAGA